MNSLNFKNKLQKVKFLYKFNILQLFNDFYSIDPIVKDKLFIENLELKTESKFNISKIYNNNNNNNNIINLRRSNSFLKANELKEKFNQEIKNKKNCFHFYSNSYKSIPIKNFSIISMNKIN